MLCLFNSLWPSDAIWSTSQNYVDFIIGSGNWLNIACHDLNQCWHQEQISVEFDQDIMIKWLTEKNAFEMSVHIKGPQNNKLNRLGWKNDFIIVAHE